MRTRYKLLILLILASPIALHEFFHASTDPRSPAYFTHIAFDWAKPLFEDENLLAGHILVNLVTVTFGLMAIIWVARKNDIKPKASEIISKASRVMEEQYSLVIGCTSCGSRNVDFVGNTKDELVIECNDCHELS